MEALMLMCTCMGAHEAGRQLNEGQSCDRRSRSVAHAAPLHSPPQEVRNSLEGWAAGGSIPGAAVCVRV